MAKLIDADALMEPLDQWAQEMRETWKSNVRVSFLIAGMVQKVEELTVSLPDASEPILAEALALRARVEQLEAAAERLLKISENILFSDPNSSDLIELYAAQEEVNLLINGFKGPNNAD